MLEITNNDQDVNKSLIGGKRKKWVDFGKGISMFLVVLYHSEVY